MFRWFWLRRLRRMRLPQGKDWGETQFMGISVQKSWWVAKPDLIGIVAFDLFMDHGVPLASFDDSREAHVGDTFTNAGKRWQFVEIERYRDPSDMFIATCRMVAGGTEAAAAVNPQGGG